MRFLILILVAFVPYLAYGASGFDMAESQQLVASLKSDVDTIIDKDVQKIRDFIKNEDPAFINKISSLKDQEQIIQMRNWMAKKAFNYYYDKYMDELKQKSQETGREIKQERFKYAEGKYVNGTTVIWWLDRGDLDKDKCKKLDVLNSCDYPDGFEEYEISLDVLGNTRESENFAVQLHVFKDDVVNNSSKQILINLSADQYKYAGDNEYSFDTSVLIDSIATTEKYDDRQRLRNQEAADIRAGKYRKPTKKEQREFMAKHKGSPIDEKLFIVTDESRKWQSDFLPDAAVATMTALYDNSYSHAETEQ